MMHVSVVHIMPTNNCIEIIEIVWHHLLFAIIIFGELYWSWLPFFDAKVVIYCINLSTEKHVIIMRTANYLPNPLIWLEGRIVS